jgi:hypothetical protein
MCSIDFKILLHDFDSAHLDSSHLPGFPEHLVMNEHFPKVYYLNMHVLGFPDLPLGQWPPAFAAGLCCFDSHLPV